MTLMIASSFFFNDTATTEIYTLSLHDALPISFTDDLDRISQQLFALTTNGGTEYVARVLQTRSEEHTSELQSRRDLVCRLLLEKKKKNPSNTKPGTSEIPSNYDIKRCTTVTSD